MGHIPSIIKVPSTEPSTMGDLHEHIERTFQQCENCDGYYVNLSTHTCEATSTGDPTREERIHLASLDGRPDGDQVAILPTRTVDGSYAYHELDADGRPLCGGGGSLTDDWVVIAREKAKNRGKAPCRTCSRLVSGSTDTAH